MMINFETLPPPGTVVRLDEQSYEFIGTVPHVRRDGIEIELLVFETICPSCSRPFRCKTVPKSSGLTRRCPACVKPGKPVKGKRGRKLRVEVLEA